MNGLVNSAYDRLGHRLEPLISLAEAPAPADAAGYRAFTEKLAKDLGLVGMAMGQALAQLAHIKRYLALRETWGPSRAGEAKAVLKKAYNEFHPQTIFGGELFKPLENFIINFAIIINTRYISYSFSNRAIV